MSKVDANDKRFYGVYPATVTSVKDDTKEGQVTVKFDWYDGGKTEYVGRVRQQYAGDKFGAFFIPEPKSEVLVSFLYGRMSIPIILGGLYNGKDKPPTYRADDKDEKMIRTKAGNQIVLVDTKGSEKIVIVDKDGNNQIVIDTAKDTITISSKNGTINLEANEINIKSKANTKIEATGTMTVKGSTIDLN